MATIFTKIIRGEIPCYKVAEDANFFAFLDINPLHAGHTLVVTRLETDYIFDLDDTTLSELIIFSKRVASAIEKVVECKRIGVAIIGLEVPHVHVHLVPMNSMADIDFTKPKLKFTPDEFRSIAEKISSHFKN